MKLYRCDICSMEMRHPYNARRQTIRGTYLDTKLEFELAKIQSYTIQTDIHGTEFYSGKEIDVCDECSMKAIRMIAQEYL